MKLGFILSFLKTPLRTRPNCLLESKMIQLKQQFNVLKKYGKNFKRLLT